MDQLRSANSRVDIDLDSIAWNVRELRKRNGNQSRLMAVVKGDGYGHGAVMIARQCLDAGADRLGVASVWEGIALQKSGVSCPILVLGLAAHDAIVEAVNFGLDLTVVDQEAVVRADRASKAAGVRCSLHIKVDSGMSRLGIREANEIVALAQAISERKHVCFTGMFTHFAEAETSDKTETMAQFSRFTGIVDVLKRKGLSPELIHAANSAAAVEHPEFACDFVRPGLSIYGYYPAVRQREFVELRPALTWKSEVRQVKQIPKGAGVSYNFTWHAVRPTVLANVPVGYTDGLRRSLSGRHEVLIKGRRVPIVGRICMDQIMVDVTDIDVNTGDEVVLLGKQGEQEISMEEWTGKLETVPQEVLTLIGKRTARAYYRNGKPIAVRGVLSDDITMIDEEDI